METSAIQGTLLRFGLFRRVSIKVVGASLALLSLVAYAPRGGAQQSLVLASNRSLPEDPGVGVAAPAQASSSTTETSGTGRVDGTVEDMSGGTVSGAKVTLTRQGADTGRTVVTTPSGAFGFDTVESGNYSISIAVAGMKTLVLPVLKLQAGEHREVPVISLGIAASSTSVDVVATTEEIAQAQVQLEEKQRVIGIVPNFYTSYIWNAAPLTTRQKYALAAHAIFDPVAFIGAGVAAGVEQQQNTFPGYGQGAQGYGKRYGAAYADGAIGQTLSDAVLASAFHQDPRYFYRGTGTKKERVLYALEMVVVQRADDGHLEPGYSKIIGNFAAGGISNIYRAPSDRSAQTTIDNGLLQFAGRAADNLVKEFLLKKLTPKLPVYDIGKPAGDTGNTVLTGTTSKSPAATP